MAGYAGGAMDVPNAVLLVRYLPDGRLDAAFGNGGAVTTDFGAHNNGLGRALALKPDGKIIVAGGVTAGLHFGSTILVRYLPDGRVDDSFGAGGKVTVSPVGSGNAASALLLQADGKLVVTGSAFTAVTPGTMFITRFQPDGRVDDTFGVGGLVTTAPGGQAFARALRQQPDGKLVVTGAFSTAGANDILLARYQALGCPAVDPEPCLVSLAAFVTEAYQAALARVPDASEVAYWVDVLTTEPTPNTVRGMLHVVFDGPEFRQRPVNPWRYVAALYQAVLGRDPSPAELDGWVQAVLERLNTLLPAFTGSSEFQRLVPDCQDQGAVTLLVGRLYQQVLSRVPSWEEIAWWTQDIITWCALSDTVEGLFNVLEYLSVPRTLADHVTVLYRALLAREPDAGGLAWGVGELAGQLATLEDDVIASPEFEAQVYRLFP